MLFQSTLVVAFDSTLRQLTVEFNRPEAFSITYNVALLQVLAFLGSISFLTGSTTFTFKFFAIGPSSIEATIFGNFFAVGVLVTACVVRTSISISLLAGFTAVCLQQNTALKPFHTASTLG